MPLGVAASISDTLIKASADVALVLSCPHLPLLPAWGLLVTHPSFESTIFDAPALREPSESLLGFALPADVGCLQHQGRGEGCGQGKHGTVAGNHSVFSSVGAQLCLPLGWFCSRLSPVTGLHWCGLGGGFLAGDRDSLEHCWLGKATTATI